MEKFIKRELFWNRVMFALVGGIAFFGLVIASLVFVVFVGAIAVEGLGAPSLLGGDLRIERLTYGLAALAIVSALTRNGIYRFWQMARTQIREAHDGHVSSIYRASRCFPEYYR